MRGASLSAAGVHQAAQFLYEEAALLDDGRFDEWLALMTEDIEYRAPVRVTRGRGEGSELSAEMYHFDETLATLRLRVARLASGKAWAEDPPSRTRHFVSNVRAWGGERPDEILVSSALLVYRNRGDDAGHELFSAARTDTLRLGGGVRLARRLIAFDQATLGTRNLGIFF